MSPRANDTRPELTAAVKDKIVKLYRDYDVSLGALPERFCRKAETIGEILNAAGVARPGLKRAQAVKP